MKLGWDSLDVKSRRNGRLSVSEIGGHFRFILSSSFFFFSKMFYFTFHFRFSRRHKRKTGKWLRLWQRNWKKIAPSTCVSLCVSVSKCVKVGAVMDVSNCHWIVAAAVANKKMCGGGGGERGGVEGKRATSCPIIQRSGGIMETCGQRAALNGSWWHSWKLNLIGFVNWINALLSLSWRFIN